MMVGYTRYTRRLEIHNQMEQYPHLFSKSLRSRGDKYLMMNNSITAINHKIALIALVKAEGYKTVLKYPSIGPAARMVIVSLRNKDEQELQEMIDMLKERINAIRNKYKYCKR